MARPPASAYAWRWTHTFSVGVRFQTHFFRLETVHGSWLSKESLRADESRSKGKHEVRGASSQTVLNATMPALGSPRRLWRTRRESSTHATAG